MLESVKVVVFAALLWVTVKAAEALTELGLYDEDEV